MATSMSPYQKSYVASLNKDDLQAKKKTILAMIPQFQKALPDFFKPDRFARICCNLLVPKDSKDMKRVQDLLNCSPDTFFGALLACAQLGLEPDGLLGQAYLIPYGGRCQLILGYRGLIDLARRSGELSSVVAHEVCENDTFTFDFGTCELPHHTFDLRKPRGEVIAFYAIARFKDGSYHFDLMPKEEVDAIRARSQSAKMGSSPWHTDYIEMGKKTVIRRIAKYLPMNVQRACTLDENAVRAEKDNDIIIETSFTEVETENERTFQDTRQQLLAENDEAEEPEPEPDAPKITKGKTAKKAPEQKPRDFDWYMNAIAKVETVPQLDILEEQFKRDSETFDDGDYCTVINEFDAKKEKLTK